MIRFVRGNLLEADAEALVNTVNTVGVMGKGIALMFKESFPENFKKYAKASKAGEVEIGRMFVTHRPDLIGPQWIINFPTKRHWRDRTRLEWIQEGLRDLRRVILENGIRSVAIPPLGCGNGKLDWNDVRPEIEHSFEDIDGVSVLVYEPTAKYQKVVKRSGVHSLTPARAMIAELIRRYGIPGMSCSILEAQKLAWFLERTIEKLGLDNPLQLSFVANRYGPYSDKLRHLLDSMDGSYLHCEKRLADASPADTIWFEYSKKDFVQTYLNGPEGEPYLSALHETARLIEGYESPYGLELLATVDWLLQNGCSPDVESVEEGIRDWPEGKSSAERKIRLFDRRVLNLALERLESCSVTEP